MTDFQEALARLLASNRTPESYLAGGSALHLQPNSTRISDDLDYFHDSEERVAEAFARDRRLLAAQGYGVDIEISQPGYIRAIVSREAESTKEVGCLYDSPNAHDRRSDRVRGAVLELAGGHGHRAGGEGPVGGSSPERGARPVRVPLTDRRSTASLESRACPRRTA